MSDWTLDERVGCVAVYEGPKRNCLDAPLGSFIFYRHGYRDESGWNVKPEDVALARLLFAAPELAEVLKRIIEDLPIRRDWLDPDLERAALNALRTAGIEVQP